MSEDPKDSPPESGRESKNKKVVYAEESFQGPIAHPEHVRQYEQIMTGAADRIFTMAEKEQGSRHKLTRWDLLFYHSGRLLALLFAFLIAALTIGGGIYLLYHDKSVTGMITLLTGLGSLVGSFLYKESKTLKNDDEKNVNSDSSKHQ